MPTTYRPYAPDQDLLLQPRLQEWLPEGIDKLIIKPACTP